jgi:hypothetical protein
LEEDGSHGQKAQVAKHAQMESMLELEAEKPQSKKWKFRRLEDVDKQGRTVNVQEAVELQAKKGSRRKSEVHEGETSPTRMEEEDQTTSLLATENNVKHKIKKVKEKGRTSGELEEEQHQVKRNTTSCSRQGGVLVSKPLSDIRKNVNLSTVIYQLV